MESHGENRNRNSRKILSFLAMFTVLLIWLELRVFFRICIKQHIYLWSKRDYGSFNFWRIKQKKVLLNIFTPIQMEVFFG